MQMFFFARVILIKMKKKNENGKHENENRVTHKLCGAVEAKA